MSPSCGSIYSEYTPHWGRYILLHIDTLRRGWWNTITKGNVYTLSPYLFVALFIGELYWSLCESSNRWFISITGLWSCKEI